MEPWMIAALVAAAFVIGRWLGVAYGERRAVRDISIAIRAGRSQQARALRRVLEDPNISAEIDR